MTTYSPFEIILATFFIALVTSPVILAGYLLVFRTEQVLKRIIKLRDKMDIFDTGYPNFFSERRIIRQYRVLGIVFIVVYLGIIGLLLRVFIQALRAS